MKLSVFDFQRQASPALFASLAAYAISKVNISVLYLTCTRWYIGQHANSFSHNGSSCGVSEAKQNIHRTWALPFLVFHLLYFIIHILKNIIVIIWVSTCSYIFLIFGRFPDSMFLQNRSCKKERRAVNFMYLIFICIWFYSST